MKLDIRPATTEDAKALAVVMRPEDQAEVLASDSWSPLGALTEGLRVSDATWALCAGPEILAMFGVRQLAEGVQAWALTGAGVEKYPLAFSKAAREIVSTLLSEYGSLTNIIDERYTRAIDFYGRLGFKQRGKLYSSSGVPFIKVEMRKE